MFYDALNKLDDRLNLDVDISSCTRFNDKLIREFLNKHGLNNVRYLDEGSYRMVFIVNNCVIKVAKNTNGRCCNEFESIFYSEYACPTQKLYLPKMLWHSKSNWIIIQEFIDGVSSYDDETFGDEEARALFDTFPSYMTGDYHGCNIMVDMNCIPKVIDFAVNDGDYYVREALEKFAAKGKWKPRYKTATYSPWPPNTGTFVKFRVPVKGCHFGYVTEQIKVDRDSRPGFNGPLDYTTYLIYDADEYGTHEFHWLMNIDEEEMRVLKFNINDSKIMGEVQSPKYFEHLLSQL